MRIQPTQTILCGDERPRKHEANRRQTRGAVWVLESSTPKAIEVARTLSFQWLPRAAIFVSDRAHNDKENIYRLYFQRPGASPLRRACRRPSFQCAEACHFDRVRHHPRDKEVGSYTLIPFSRYKVARSRRLNRPSRDKVVGSHTLIPFSRYESEGSSLQNRITRQKSYVNKPSILEV